MDWRQQGHLTLRSSPRRRSGKVQGKLRGLVSQNRRRFLKHGFDLDCTYITNRVRIPLPAVAMATFSPFLTVSFHRPQLLLRPFSRN